MDPKVPRKEGTTRKRWFPGEHRQGGARDLLEECAGCDGGDGLVATFEIGEDAEYVARLHEAARYRQTLDSDRGISHEHFSLLLSVPEKGPRADVLRAISNERTAQDSKWGKSFPGRPWDRWLTILVEEVGEVADAILEGDEARIRRELEQVAAVAVSALEHGAENLDTHGRVES